METPLGGFRTLGQFFSSRQFLSATVIEKAQYSVGGIYNCQYKCSRDFVNWFIKHNKAGKILFQTKIEFPELGRVLDFVFSFFKNLTCLVVLLPVIILSLKIFLKISVFSLNGLIGIPEDPFTLYSTNQGLGVEYAHNTTNNPPYSSMRFIGDVEVPPVKYGLQSIKFITVNGCSDISIQRIEGEKEFIVGLMGDLEFNQALDDKSVIPQVS